MSEKPLKVTPENRVRTVTNKATVELALSETDKRWHATVTEVVCNDNQVQGVLLYLPGVTYSTLKK